MTIKKEIAAILMKGPVLKLHVQLIKLGYDIPEAELKKQYYGQGTRTALRDFQSAHGLPVTGSVDEATRNRIQQVLEEKGTGQDEPGTVPEQFAVHGQVFEPGGTPFANGLVQAYHRSFRSKDILLGKATTDDDGYYSIFYSLKSLGERKQANLFVQVFDSSGAIIATCEGEIVFNAPPDVERNLRIDLTKYRGASEYTRLLAKVTPLLGKESLSSLTDPEITHLSGESGVDVQRLRLAVQASQRAAETKIPAEVFYALSRQQMNISSIDVLAKQNMRALSSGLKAGINANIIDQIEEQKVKEYLDALQNQIVDSTLKGDLGSLLKTSLILKDDQSRLKNFIGKYSTRDGATDMFWDDLAKDPGFADEEVRDEFRFTMELGRIVENHISLVQAIQNSRNQLQIRSTRDLAKLSREDWQALVASSGAPSNVAGDTDEQRIHNFANQIYGKIERSYPTEIIRNHCSQVNAEVPDVAVLHQFLQDNPAFEFGRARIIDHLPQGATNETIASLKAWDRLYKLAPVQGRWETMVALKRAGLDSAYKIVQMGRSAFIREYSANLGGESQAEEVWNSSRHLAAMALALYAEFGAAFNRVVPKVIPYLDIDKKYPETAKSRLYANPKEQTSLWRELFGPLDCIECDHDRSVYGPAAYLVDLFHFLRDAPRKNGNSSLDILFRRRPDLAGLELSPENTITLMPYVDLVNEVLENAITPLYFDASSRLISALQNGERAIVADIFGAAGYPLSNDWTWSPGVETTGILITDGRDQYSISGVSGQVKVYVFKKYQTDTVQDELGVLPEHINWRAYQVLSQAVYPWVLPLNPWIEEARIYLKHLGFERFAWMERLADKDYQPLCSEEQLRIARDHLNISAKEYGLICNMSSFGKSEKELWGFSDSDWCDEVRKVRVFLQKACFTDPSFGQGYRSLRELLATSCINGDDNLYIRFEGEPSDLDSAVVAHNQGDSWFEIPNIYPKDQPPAWLVKLSDIRRFLRLRHKLGWTIRELDKTITAFNAGIESDLLVNISFILRLQTELRVQLTEMLSWWGLLDTAEDRFETDGCKKQQSLYERVFLDKSLENPGSDIFSLNIERNDLEIPGKTISEYVGTIAAALEANVDDLIFLISGDHQNPPEVADQLNLRNLSALYRILSLARALKLSPKEFIAIKSLIGIDPFSSPCESFNFIKKIDKMKVSGFSIAELKYLCQPDKVTEKKVALGDDEILRHLSELRSELNKICGEPIPSADPDGALIRGCLVELLPSDRIEEIMTVILGDPDLTLETQIELVNELLIPYVDFSSAEKLLTSDVWQSKEQRFTYLLISLYTYLRNKTSKTLLQEHIFGVTGLEAEVTLLLLQDVVKSCFDKEKPVLEDFLALSTSGMDVTCPSDVSVTSPDLGIVHYEIKSNTDSDFTIQWQGWMQAESSDIFTLRAIGPDGDVNDKVKISLLDPAFSEGRSIEANPISIDLKAAELYLIKIDYHSSGRGEDGVSLLWKSTKAIEQTVPADRFIPAVVVEANRRSYAVLHKASLLISKFKMTAEEIKYLSYHSDDFYNFNLNMFSNENTFDTKRLLFQLEQLSNLFSFRDRYPVQELNLIDVFRVATQASDSSVAISDATKRLLILTGWDEGDLTYLIGPMGWSLTERDFRNGSKFNILDDVFRQIRKLGISAGQFINWIRSNFDLEQDVKDIADDLRRIIRSRYNRNQWIKIAKPLRDALREKQRSALVSYLIVRDGLSDSNDLYACYLIDVEMSPCMLTSRLVQATSAVQLFVQRCLMNLEPNVTLSPDEAAEWKWRGNYRVWEANRKVFLYPENWIEPELRDDKSPFFQELEDELLQKEITVEAVEAAFNHYLEKLDQVAHLEIVGICEEEDDRSGGKTVHVFGRTYSEPHIYYYRRWVDSKNWTPWERIDLDIQGDHLIPVVWNRQLYLFWAVFKEKAVPIDKDCKDKDNKEKYDSAVKSYIETWDDDNIKYWEIQLAWSEYKAGKWSHRKTSRAHLTSLYYFSSTGKTNSESENGNANGASNGSNGHGGTKPDFDPGDNRSPKVLSIAGENVDNISSTPGFIKCDKELIAGDADAIIKYTDYWKTGNIQWIADFISFGLTTITPEYFSIQGFLPRPDTLDAEVLRTKLYAFGEFRFMTGRREFVVYDELIGSNATEIISPYGTSLQKMAFWEKTVKLQDQDNIEIPLVLPIGGTSNYLEKFEEQGTDDSGNKIPIEFFRILDHTPYPFKLILPPHNFCHRNFCLPSGAPFVYQDEQHSFFVTPIRLTDYRHWQSCIFVPLFHPFISELLKRFACDGVNGILHPSTHALKIYYFKDYVPAEEYISGYRFSYVPEPFPCKEIDFSPQGSYSIYNWELFFHIPLRIADQLTKNQRFEEAMKWYHYIFDPVAGITHGLLGTYFNDVDLKTPCLSRIDKSINFDWGNSSPDPTVTIEGFSVRWIGKLQAPETGVYTFFTSTDDGVRLWVDNRMLINKWFDQAVEKDKHSGSIVLQASHLYDIKMEYYENRGEAVAQLSWEGPNIPRQIIPEERFFAWAPYWKFLPFAEAEARYPMQSLMRYLAFPPNAKGELADEILQLLKEIENQISEWEANPFKPHVLARLRTAAYMKSVVMKYIENLIAWGDQLFRQDTLESVNQAAQLYILAAEILGQRPDAIPSQGCQDLTFGEIENQMDEFSNVLVNIENFLMEALSKPDGTNNTRSENLPALILYFCIPNNDKLLGYWGTVNDRLFKLRHCMNIEGVVRHLPLFQPPIEPGLLVRAAAAGIDLGSVLRDLNTQSPHYRFSHMLRIALEFCGEVRSLGTSLLSVLEKRDAEELSLLRSSQEIRLLKVTKEIRKRQIVEAEKTLESLNHAMELSQIKYEFYRNIKKISPGEKTHLDLLTASSILQMLSQEAEIAGSSAHSGPDFIVGGMAGMGGGPITVTKTGGSSAGAATQAFGQALGMYASWLTTGATLSSISAGHERRWDEWKLQERLAKKEIEQIEKQIVAAEIRLAIAEKELENHELQIENADESDAFLKDKFTNKQLYNWMMSRISSIYFQSYQMAYDLARQAEIAYQKELGVANSNFIQFGYWDSLKKGLLAGEQLNHDLKRMEFSYLAQNKREYEITKHVSLRQLNPLALLALKATGKCEIAIPEWLFDMDCPGHYMRRIKSVALSIPSVTGPYTSINSTLSLQKSTVRCSLDTSNGYVRDLEGNDTRFVDYFGNVQSIVTSSAQSDSGMFETNLHDERYLPFEGAGAESTWCIELPTEYRQFDYNTISDVILHIRYTAREGGGAFKDAAIKSPKEKMLPNADTKLMQIFSLQHDFPTEWSAFLSGSKFTATIKKVYFPYIIQGRSVELNEMTLHAISGNNIVPSESVDFSGFSKDFNKPEFTFVLSETQEAFIHDVLLVDKQSQVFLLLSYTAE